MKKLILITLTVLVCLCLLGCAEDTVTPNEPAAPETPNEPETPAEPEDNVIMLPEADENTKYITIEFPEDFPEEPYVEPNLVSPEEFEWGEYVPVITYGIGTVPDIAYDEWIIESAVLSREADSLSDAHDSYVNVYGHIGEYLYDQQYKSDYFQRKNVDLADEVGVYFSLIEGINDDIKTYIDGAEHKIRINEAENKDVIVSAADSCSDKIWIFEVFYTNEYALATYIYNTETKESAFLGSHLFGASLSPDGKYLAYTSPTGDLCSIRSANTYTPEKQGFYVKNLENGKTVFYRCDSKCYPHHGHHYIKAWVKV